ncbi:unnamed protein product [Schistosoma intercalatum]|nr:unnamed protein product [Schistosoma intercalatum]
MTLQQHGNGVSIQRLKQSIDNPALHSVLYISSGRFSTIILKNKALLSTLEAVHTLIANDAFTEVFEADPCVVDLKRKGSMYYMLLCNLLMSGHVRVPQIVATGTKVFQSRLKMIMDASLNASRQDTLSSTAKFDSLEMALFRIGQTDRLQFERWISRHHEKIEALRKVRPVFVK